VGGLRILKGSHKAGFLAPRLAPGPGGNTVDVDPTLDWLQTDYRAGDLLLFKALTVHAATENQTPDRIRLSTDFRYAGLSHTVTEHWLQPHYHELGVGEFTWDVIKKDWRNSPTAQYWERVPNLKTKPRVVIKAE